MVIKTIPVGGINCQFSDITLLVDPASQQKGDIILKTKADFPLKPSSSEVINGAGEYEISGIKIRGINIDKETMPDFLRTAYVVGMDGMRLGFLGALNSELNEDVIDKLGEVDILFVPTGKDCIDVKGANALIKQIEPKIVIPTGADIKDLAEELGQKPEFQEKLVIKKKDLEENTTKLIWMVK